MTAVIICIAAVIIPHFPPEVGKTHEENGVFHSVEKSGVINSDITRFNN